MDWIPPREVDWIPVEERLPRLNFDYVAVLYEGQAHIGRYNVQEKKWQVRVNECNYPSPIFVTCSADNGPTHWFSFPPFPLENEKQVLAGGDADDKKAATLRAARQWLQEQGEKGASMPIGQQCLFKLVDKALWGAGALWGAPKLNTAGTSGMKDRALQAARGLLLAPRDLDFWVPDRVKDTIAQIDKALEE